MAKDYIKARLKIAGLLLNRRLELHLSLEQVAEITGYKVATISKIEQGKFWPSLGELVSIADALDMDVELINRG